MVSHLVRQAFQRRAAALVMKHLCAKATLKVMSRAIVLADTTDQSLCRASRCLRISEAQCGCMVVRSSIHVMQSQDIGRYSFIKMLPVSHDTPYGGMNHLTLQIWTYSRFVKVWIADDLVTFVRPDLLTNFVDLVCPMDIAHAAPSSPL